MTNIEIISLEVTLAIILLGLTLCFVFKESIANIRGSLFLFTNRPFRVGDKVRLSKIGAIQINQNEVGTRTITINKTNKKIEGIVTNISWCRTTIKTVDDGVIILDNSTVTSMMMEKLTNSRSKL